MSNWIKKTLGTKSKLKAGQDKIKKIQALDSSHFPRKNHFRNVVKII